MVEIPGNLGFQIRFHGNWNIFKYKILKYSNVYRVFLPRQDSRFQNLKRRSYQIPIRDGPLEVTCLKPLNYQKIVFIIGQLVLLTILKANLVFLQSMLKSNSYIHSININLYFVYFYEIQINGTKRHLIISRTLIVPRMSILTIPWIATFLQIKVVFILWKSRYGHNI